MREIWLKENKKEIINGFRFDRAPQLASTVGAQGSLFHPKSPCTLCANGNTVNYKMYILQILFLLYFHNQNSKVQIASHRLQHYILLDWFVHVPFANKGCKIKEIEKSMKMTNTTNCITPSQVLHVACCWTDFCAWGIRAQPFLSQGQHKYMFTMISTSA